MFHDKAFMAPSALARLTQGSSIENCQQNLFLATRFSERAGTVRSPSSIMEAVSETFVEEFKEQCAASMQVVKTIVETERVPRLAAGVSHEYRDKFLLAEWVTNALIVSLIDIFRFINLSPDHLATAAQWAESKSVTLRFRREERCKVCFVLQFLLPKKKPSLISYFLSVSSQEEDRRRDAY